MESTVRAKEETKKITPPYIVGAKAYYPFETTFVDGDGEDDKLKQVYTIRHIFKPFPDDSELIIKFSEFDADRSIADSNDGVKQLHSGSQQGVFFHDETCVEAWIIKPDGEESQLKLEEIRDLPDGYKQDGFKAYFRYFVKIIKEGDPLAWLYKSTSKGKQIKVEVRIGDKTNPANIFYCLFNRPSDNDISEYETNVVDDIQKQKERTIVVDRYYLSRKFNLYFSTAENIRIVKSLEEQTDYVGEWLDKATDNTDRQIFLKHFDPLMKAAIYAEVVKFCLRPLGNLKKG